MSRLPPIATMRGVVKTLLRRAGIELSRSDRSPMRTLLGLRSLPVRSIVDVGANKGQFAKWISAFFPRAHIYAFEPLSGPYATLRAWADLHRENVTIANLALGDAPGETVMNLHIDDTPSSSLLMATSLNDSIYPNTRRRTTEVVRQETLDAALASMPTRLMPDILVKLDVQGFEDRVIAGGPQTFARARACIIEVMLDSLYSGQARFPGLVNSLESLGLSYAGTLEQHYAQDGHVVFFDAIFVRHSK